jgi:hypothetical protein
LSIELPDIADMENNAIINTKWSNEAIIDLIRQLRNDLIKDFLDERFLREYLSTKYNMKEVSNVKVEFIKKDLKELLITPVNTDHYNDIIEQIKTTDSAALAEGNEQFFYKELESIFKRYIY